MKKLTHPIALAIMRISLIQFFLVVGVFCSYAKTSEGQNVLDKKVSLHLKNEKIKNVLSELEKISDVKFVYSPEIIRSSTKVNVDASGKKLDLVLQELLNPLEVKYELQKMQNSYIVLSKVMTVGGNVKYIVENKPVIDTSIHATGVVRDPSGTPLQGVTVSVKGTNIATMTNATGAFSLHVPQKSAVLRFSYAGMEPFEMAAGSGLSVGLKQSTKTIDEVVVVGYGQQRKGLVTGAISQVKSEQIATVSSTRIEQALQGRTPGVNVLPASGSPGNAMKVRIRGTGSNLAADPLYIVDGMRAGGLEYLDPTEISSFDILKDAASAAIYGAEGANGVIVVTTKTGKRSGPPEVNFAMQYGQQSLGNKMQMMNSAQYADYMKTSGTNMGNPLPTTPGPSTDWLDQIFQTAPIQRYGLNMSGGTEKTTYWVGGTYFNQLGIVGGNKASFDRYTFRINTDSRLKKWLNIGERVSYSNFTRKGVTEDSEFGSVIDNAIMLDPITPVVYNSEADYTDYFKTTLTQSTPSGTPIVDLLRKDPSGKYYGISPYVKGEIGNPMAQMDITHTQTNQNKIVGSAFVDIEPFAGFKFTSRFGIDAAFQRIHAWAPTFWWSSERLNESPTTADRTDQWFNWQWENFATYTRKIGDHNLSVLAGTSALKRKYDYLAGTTSGMFRETDEFSYPDNIPDDQDKVNGFETISTLSSYYGRLSYDYKNKYLLTAAFRRDGSSMLAPGHQWGNFPSVSAGWVISNEDFYNGALSDHLNYAKLRGSWGRNGSLSNLSPGQWLGAISTTDVTGAGIQYPDATGHFLIGAAPTTNSNPELTWETSEQTDIGLDLSFLNSRLNFSVDYYKKKTKNLIMPGQGAIPTVLGAPVQFINSGNIENRGWEFDLGVKSRNDQALKWEVNANFSTLHNEVTEVNPNFSIIQGTGVGTGWTATMFQKGQPVWYFSGYKTDGIFQNQSQIDAYLQKTGITGYKPKPGDPIVVDVNADKQISQADQTYIGTPHPKFMYGFRLNLNYKGFDFIGFIQGQNGNNILMGFNRFDRPTANKPEFFYTDRWTKDGSTNSWFAPNTSNDKIYNSDKMIFNGSYARIRQLQLGYTLPQNVLEKMHFKNLRVYVSLDDFFTFTKYPGLDPEAGSNNNNSLGIDRGVYPIPRKVLGGLSLTF
ncbi:SusC/RagA family TonB-linked outer membrane protein [Pinibacter aurantiacus]|uniref:TonB-dependent receptor n=1 Tax=Pinibacter aurantiacus TaxID=2851599 RepID=A0A9E2SBV0_9BACT|nr:TonB-dependent receptor [Pinibacter aurantiacus]MBV4358259.1 TonB-dependent receptor [Pinibacter aurantiacus]